MSATAAMREEGHKKAEIICRTPGCRWEGRVTTTVICMDSEWDAFHKGFGHGMEARCDFCAACNKLGVLQEPEQH